MKTKTRIVLIEDNPSDMIVLLRDFEQSGTVEVVESYLDGSYFLRDLNDSNLQFDVVVIDYHTPLLNGLETFRNLHYRRRPYKLLLTSHGYYRQVMEDLVAMGTQNYCRKTGDRILAALERIQEGRSIYESNEPIQQWEGITQNYSLKSRDEGEFLDAFTPLDKKIIIGIACGLGSREIARNLGYETSSIEKYRGCIMQKVGVRNSQQLVAWCFTRGMIDPQLIMEIEMSRFGVPLPTSRKRG